MSRKYYSIEDDLSIDDRWMVGELNLPEDFAWDDVESKSSVGAVDWRINILLDGQPLDVTVIDFGLIMAKRTFIDLLPANEIEYREVKVNKYRGKEKFYLIAFKNIIDCVDKTKSKYTLWEEGNDIRPDLAGTFKSIAKLRIDYKKVYPHSIFIVKDYEVARIVSQEVKEQFEERGLTGITFTEV